jgi:DNA polymerase IV (archaeal DinB-like DNA polymerase)
MTEPGTMPDPGRRIVMHVDMDAFYAAVEERYSPELRGKPVVVGADPREGHGRGVVTTANYLARKYGIGSAMPISRAWRLADAARRRGEPEAIFVRGDHELYRDVSKRIMELLADGADAFQAASIDEAYLEVSSLGSFEAAADHAAHLKADIRSHEELTCSIGIATNKLVAKIASDFQKPDGLTIVRPEAVQDFLDPMAARVLPGVGPKAEAFLRGHGIRTVSELRAVAPEQLSAWMGRWGAELAAKARGISESPVSSAWERKSLGEQTTFDQDTLEAGFILERARDLTSDVFNGLRRRGFGSFRTIAVTVRFSNFTTLSRAHTPRQPVTSEDEMWVGVLRLLLPFLDRRENPKLRPIRLIGVRAERLQRPVAAEQG